MKNTKRILLLAAFSAYALIMLYLLFGMRLSALFYAPDGYWKALCDHINPIPFETILEFTQKLGETGKNGAAVINLFGNVIMFIPLGFFLPAVFPKARPFRSCMLMALVILAVIEFTQFVTLLGTLDIDDVILNMAGAAMGYGVWRLLTMKKQ